MKYIMHRIFTFVFVLMALFGLTVGQAAAATLQLTKIGASSTVGQTFRSWLYQGLNPAFEGTTTPDAQVSITLNSANNKVTADTNGNWSFQPTTLIAGQHEVTIGSDGQEIAFTLTIDDGSSSSASTSTTTTSTTSASDSSAAGVGGASASDSGTLPVTGAVSQTMLLVLAGFSIMGLGLVGRALHHAELHSDE